MYIFLNEIKIYIVMELKIIEQIIFLVLYTN